MTPITLAPRAEGEPLPEYAARVLRYALTYGPATLSPADLEQADQAAQRTVAALPAKLDPDAARLDAHLHTLRTRIAHALAAHHQARRQADTALAALYQAPDDPDTPDTPETPQTPEQRAVRLLKAALLLVMGPRDDRSGPGSPARLIPPTPRLPSGGIALVTPPATRPPSTRPTPPPAVAAPDIQF